MGLIRAIIQALSDQPTSHQAHQPTTYPNQPVEYVPTQAASPGYYAPNRSTCCSRKWERRAARHQMQTERAMLRAEFRAERDVRRVERRGGCCGRRQRQQQQQQMLVAAAVPVIQKAIAQLGGGASTKMQVQQGNNVRDEGQHASQMQRGVVDITPEDAPPAYQEVQKRD